MEGNEGAVVVALKDPTHEYQSDRYPNRRIYYRPFTLPDPYYQSYLRVVVAYHGTGAGETGELVTAFPSANIRHGDIEIWLKY